MTTLVVCSHGTRSPVGRAVVAELVGAVRAELPEVDVRPAFVDVEEPEVGGVVAGVTGPLVVVPLLLSRGYHTKVDIARAVGTRADAVQTAPLGPHPLMSEVLLARLAETLGQDALRPGDHLVLAAAGSSEAVAAVDVEATAADLRRHVSVPVSVGFAAGATPRIADAVAQARADGAGRVVCLSYVLAPGHFADVVRTAGADLTTAPLGADPRIARIVADRFAAALRQSGGI